MRGARYCSPPCLERALIELLRPVRSSSKRAAVAPHRIPLGLVLLSRQQLTTEQLRHALEAQRTAATAGPTAKKIGEWLRELGFATEQQVTAALARQWSCPVLQSSSTGISANRLPPIPLLFLEYFQVMPVELVEATGSLLMAFGGGIDYSILYAIEQMLGFHTQACLVRPSILRKNLQSIAQHHRIDDVVFDGIQDAAECARIIGNYTATVKAEEVRMASCGEYLWVRLERLPRDAVTLVLRAPHSSLLAMAYI